MKTLAFAAAIGLSLAVAAPSFAQTTPPRDTGNMAYPTPVPQGGATTSPSVGSPSGSTGSAQFPAPVPQGNLSTTNTTTGVRTPTDTGNMAYPAPLPQGNVGTTMPAK